MKELSEKHCKSCEGDTRLLSSNEVKRCLQRVRGWELTGDRKGISRRFEFKGFNRTIAFVNALAWICNQEGHHPHFQAGYNYCDVLFTTYAIDGLSENDFICASRANALLEN